MDAQRVFSMAAVFGGKNSKDTESPDLMGVNCGPLPVDLVITSSHVELVVGGRIGALVALVAGGIAVFGATAHFSGAADFKELKTIMGRT